MNLEKLTEKAQNIIQSAHSMALASGHQKLMPDHLLKAMFNDGGHGDRANLGRLRS